MDKKLDMVKNVFIFFIFTLIIVLATGLYLWSINKDNISTLTYIPDADWSYDRVIGEYIKSGVYDSAVDESQNLHLVWIDFNSSTKMWELYHSTVNPEGKTISAPKTIVSNKVISQVSINFYNEMLHIFWIGEGNSEKLDLYYTTLNKMGRVSLKVVLIDEFESVEDFKGISSAEGEFMLVWSDKVNDYQQIKTMLVSSSGLIERKPVQVTSSKCNSYKPNLVIDKEQRYHLVWREEYPKEIKLYYQRFNAKGEVDSAPVFIDNVDTNSASMLVSNNKLYLVWNKGKITVRDKSNKLYGTVVDLTNSSEQIEIHQLTNQYASLYDPVLGLDSSG